MASIIRITLAAFALFCTLATVGCGVSISQVKNATSGKIGCPPTQITIEDHVQNMSGHTWTARCRGKVHYCSATSNHQIDCSAPAE